MKDSKIMDLYKALDVKERKGYGSQRFKYVSSADVIDRLNKIFAGCWYTEVVFQEIIHDQVIVRVRVSIYDEDTQHTFHHEGYGGSQVARYNSGQKKGEIIDLANSYKSAEAKAIKNACSRWGVGLYLEAQDVEDFKDEEDETTSPSVTVTGTNSGNKSTAPSFPPFNFGGTETKQKTEEPVEEVSTEEQKKSEPEPEPESTNEDSKPKQNSGLPNLSGLFGGSNKSTSSGPPIRKSQNEKSDITDIQKAAITNIIKIKLNDEMTYEEMAAKALGIDVSDVSPLEELGYTDAVKLINYGNTSIKNQ